MALPWLVAADAEFCSPRPLACGKRSASTIMIGEHMTQWLGRSVELFDEARSEKPVTSADLARKCFRLAVETYDSDLTFAELFARYLANPAAAETEAIIIGAWGEVGAGDGSNEAVQLLTGARHSLPGLRAIFFGDIVGEESEISWINQSDLSPLFTAFPDLEHFGVRGTAGLDLGGPLNLPRLKSLAIQTGGMPLQIFRQATEGNLPALESLELWLGTGGYGGEITREHLTELLSGKQFPALRHLALCDSDIQDEVAEAVVASPLLARITRLDFSKGTLGDRGAQALLDTPAVAKLESLDLSHHYLSEGMMAKLRAAFPGVKLDDAQGENPQYGRYVAVGE